ncbi:MAG: hypothetical protein LBR72_04135 [Oscillospiraceae bacterium]|jgi:hypothetical protein|nr:hypothetical protein [Oscillospiraceae bacterium]
MKRFFSVLALLVLLILCAGRQDDTFTLLWYVNGSDLESAPDGGAFTQNLGEMLSALPSDGRLKVALFTGGTLDWKTEGFSESNQVHVIDMNGLTHGPALPGGSVASPETLTLFLRWGIAACPAKRYGLVFWDHGSGVPIGFGYDELREPRYMDLAAMDEGLSKGLSGVKLSFIGFDACLMATAEVAAACAPFTGTLIASEELEPFGGWDYGPLMRALGSDPGLPPADIGRVIANGYFSAEEDAILTLSVADLTRIRPVEDAVSDIARGIQSLLDTGGFAGVARARAAVKYFGGVSQSVDMVDLVSLAESFADALPEEAARLEDAVRDCVVYNRHTDGADGANGLSVYFPYHNEGIYKTFLARYPDFSRPYAALIRDFSSRLGTGRVPRMAEQKLETRDGAVRMKAPPDTLRAEGVLIRRPFLVGACGGVTIDGDDLLSAIPQRWLTINGAPVFARGEGDTVSVPALHDGRKVSLLIKLDEDGATLLGSVPEAKDGRIPRPTVYPVESGDTLAFLYPVIGSETLAEGEPFTVGINLTVRFEPAEGEFGILLTDCGQKETVITGSR